jgi:murein endopeptidase
VVESTVAKLASLPQEERIILLSAILDSYCQTNDGMRDMNRILKPFGEDLAIIAERT